MENKKDETKFDCSVCVPSKMGLEEIEKLSPEEQRELIIKIIDINANALTTVINWVMEIVKRVDENSDAIENFMNDISGEFVKLATEQGKNSEGKTHDNNK